MIFELILLALGAGLAGSGAIRVTTAQDRHSRAVAEYKRILCRIEEAKLRLESRLESLGECADAAFAKTSEANRILQPLLSTGSRHISTEWEIVGLTVLRRSTELADSYSEAKAAAVGSAIGTTLAAGSWTAVAMMGSASTGVAISGLHGVAATNAALAWLGGGSLATGGGGMIAGKLALVNIVFLPVAMMAGIAAHLNAEDIYEKARQIEVDNVRNAEINAQLEERERDIAPLLGEIASRTEVLSFAVERAKKRLFRYGVFSRMYKHCRYLIRGHYYSEKEMIEVDALGRVVDEFVSSFTSVRSSDHRGAQPRLCADSAA